MVSVGSLPSSSVSANANAPVAPSLTLSVPLTAACGAGLARLTVVAALASWPCPVTARTAMVRLDGPSQVVVCDRVPWVAVASIVNVVPSRHDVHDRRDSYPG